MPASTDINIPRADTVDYADAAVVCRYARTLIDAYARAGGYNTPSVNNAAIRSAIAEGRLWLTRTRDLIDTILAPERKPHSSPAIPHSGVAVHPTEFCKQNSDSSHERKLAHSPGESPIIPPGAARFIPALIDAYDAVYRACYGQSCHNYLRHVRLTTADRWIHGNLTLTETDIALLIGDEIDRDIRGLDPRYYTFYYTVLERWVNELTRYGRFRDIPTAEAHRRLAHLIKANLHPYLGTAQQAEIKFHWLQTYGLTQPRPTTY